MEDFSSKKSIGSNLFYASDNISNPWKNEFQHKEAIYQAN